MTYDIQSNREIYVREDLTVKFTGYSSTGFIRDLPVNGGELVRDVRVSEIVGGNLTDVPYDVYDNESDGSTTYDFLLIDIGDYENKTGETLTYRIEYTYILTKSQEGKNNIALNAIGVGRDPYCDIKNANVTLILPNGYKSYECSIGSIYSDEEREMTESTKDGRTVLSLSSLALDYNEGVTVGLTFEDGALTGYFDFTPYIFAILGAVLLVVVIILKMTVFSNNNVVPVINFEAPEKSDPLLMGKLIDNKVDTEDITSMIFYWADKGYLKIDLTDQNDPVLIRVFNQLPAGTPDYEQTLFYGLFAGGEVVRTSSLANRFYVTVDKATSQVNSSAKGLFEKSSMVACLIFAILCGVVAGIAPLIIGFFGLSSKYLTFIPLAMIIPMIIINAIGQGIITGQYKFKKGTVWLLRLAALGVTAFATFLYVLLTPPFVMQVVPEIIVSVVCCLAAYLSAMLISRTKEYTQKLNDIVGFKQFILLAEKDQIEKLLETNPQFYYHVLPYAQVLGVSDKWEDKFRDITLPPPVWCTNSYGFFEFYMFNRILHNSFAHMNSHMYSRPNSSGSSGHGGFGGGHVGGGHGGGGFRGR